MSFMLDEISIKKSFQYLPVGTVKEYVNVGTREGKSEFVPLAKDALVLMIKHWMTAGKFQ